MKRATIEAFFPDVKGCPTIAGSGRGSSPRVAIANAMASVLKNPRLRKKQWRTVRTTITVVTVPVEAPSNIPNVDTGKATMPVAKLQW